MKKFILLQSLFFTAILFLDDDLIKWISIFTIASYLICTWHKTTGNKDHLMMIAIMVLTLTADGFLLFTDFFFIGISLFVGVQFGYAYRLKFLLKCSNYSLGWQFLLPFVMIFVIALKSIPLMAALYALLILSNVFLSIKYLYFNILNHRIFALGMVLFLFCDINVLIYNLPLQSYVLHDLSRVSMWIFYLPSQTLLAISAVMPVRLSPTAPS
jgi:hypothetical protein